ncbi:MAG: hypothetical protein JXO22_04250 [Phycisphaerae bacterium]|nr:hypothetical protein [Phycisphaerae bacterium]
MAARHPCFEWCRESASDPGEILDLALGCFGTAEALFQYASLLYPRFVELDGYVLLEGTGLREAWHDWCREHKPHEARAVLNHQHVEDLFGMRADNGIAGYVDEIGELIAHFWRMAVERQFPNASVQVEYEDGVIYVWQDPADVNQAGPSEAGEQ